MSAASRARLQELWQNQKLGKYLRREAFKFWCSTQANGDIEILSAVGSHDPLADIALGEQLIRGDRKAIPALLQKLVVDKEGYWWQFGRYIWSDELSVALDDTLTKRGKDFDRSWDDKRRESVDWIVYEMVMRLPVPAAEVLLLKHWDHLRYSTYFVQAALFVATPPLRVLVAEDVSECPAPQEIFKHLSMHFGIKTRGHPGVSRIAQIEALLPYLDYLDDMTVQSLWETCNDKGWFAFRRKYLDKLLRTDRKDVAFTDDKLLMAEFDKLIDKGRGLWIDHWMEAYLRTGVSIDHAMTMVVAWLRRRPEISALELACKALVHSGRRTHFPAFGEITIAPEAEAEAILKDAAFALQRRSLH